MKKTLILMLMNLIILKSFAQEFSKGTQVGSLGIGIGGAFGNYMTSSSTPAISLQYERGFWDVGANGVISLGGYLGYRSFSYKYKGASNYTQSWNYTIIGLRSAFHYNGFEIPKLDPYGGLMLSYNYLRYRYDGSDDANKFGSYGSNIGFSGYLGARYYFIPNLAGFAELGFGISHLTIGAALKF